MNHLRIGGRIRIGVDCNEVVRAGMVRDDSGEVEELLTVSRVESFLQKASEWSKVVLIFYWVSEVSTHWRTLNGEHDHARVGYGTRCWVDGYFGRQFTSCAGKT